MKMARKKSAPDDEPPKTFKIEEAREAKLLSDNAVRLAESAAKALVAAEAMGIKTKPLEDFSLSSIQRGVVLAVPGISKALRAKLMRKKASSFTIFDVASLIMALAEASTEAEAERQMAYLFVAKHLTERLGERIAAPEESKPRKAKEPKTSADPNAVYQFKITLIGSNPPIWRRIQVADGTLDKLHEHIQTAMGWTNSHLHQFEIGEKRYGDPELLDDGFDDVECVDSTRARLSKIVPKTGKRFSFTYEYDFGDGWEHEVLFEGCPKKESGKNYPLCLEGDRACPPEDVGGIVGFYEFLEALTDPKHERHEDFKEWGGDFDPEKFDARQATKAMKKGLPDWREME
jgi:Plasmid pRiA4b ORF-3-like protein